VNSNRSFAILFLNDLAREGARTFAYGTLILSLLLPTAPAFANAGAAAIALPAPAANDEAVPGPSPVYDVRSVDKKLGQLAQLSYEIDARDTPEYGRKILRKRADRLYEVLESEIGRETSEAELAATGGKAPPGAAQRLAQVKWRWTQLQSLARRSRVDAHGRMLLDPAGPVNEKNVIDLSVHAEDANPTQLKEESPDRLNDRFKNWASSGYRGAMKFTNEYAVFSIAAGLHAMWQAGMQIYGRDDVTDPLVLENWEKQTFSALGAAGFALFMSANHSTMRLYGHLKLLIAERAISKQAAGMLVGYLGMSAGLLLQSLFTEFATDKSVWDCLRPYYNKNASIVPQACEKMRDTWINGGKILNYWPSAISMIGAAGISTFIRLGINFAGSKAAQTSAGQAVVSTAGVIKRSLKSNGMMVVHKSKLPEILKLIPGAKTVGGAGLSALRVLPGFAGGIGDLLFFMVINDSVTETWVSSKMQDIRMNYVDPNAWMMKHLNYHTDFFWPSGGTYQPLRNAFDAEATNTWGAHNYLMDLYRTMQKNGWQDPGPIEACAPKEIQDALAKAKAGEKKDGKSVLLAKKSDQQLACEVIRQPKALLERYGKVNAEWRGLLLEHYSRAVNNWIEMISRFYTVYQATHKLEKHFAEQKYNMIYGGQTTPPDLRREELAKVISGGQQEGAASAAPETERKHNAFLNNTWVPTPELIDFVIAGFACGPDPKVDKKTMEKSFFARFADDFYSYFMRRKVSESYLTTHYGSSIQFVPPKLTNKARTICENASPDMYGTVNYMLGNPFPDRDPKKPGIKNPFTGPFYDENNKKYASLAEFVFANMDPATYEVKDGSNAAKWRTDHLIEPVAEVWENYIKVYNGMIQHKYIPALFDRTYRGGCRQAEEMVKGTAPKAAASELESFADSSQPACANASTAYRVGNGYFLSIEIELRNYLRGLYSLYTSTFEKSDVTPQAKSHFMQIANELIRNVRTTKPQMFTPVDKATAEDRALNIHVRSFDFENTLDEAQKLADQLAELVATRLKMKQENKFRAEMLEQFKAQLAKIITDENAQLSVVKQIYVFDDNYSGPGKKLDTATSAKAIKGR